jgi:NADP-dependent 3-hydroxy acid dehydrogenase YdfG
VRSRRDSTAGDEARASSPRRNARAGRLDILRNNAGVMLNATLAVATAEDWRRMIELNALALMNATHAAWLLMKAQGGGHVVNVSSVATTRNSGVSVYWRARSR